jgi:hypothetical protein
VSARELMREVVHNELSGGSAPTTYWRYREIDKSNGTEKLFEVYETKSGTVRELLQVNGKPLSPAQQAKQQAHLNAILENPSLARKKAKASSHDTNKEERLFALLPKAFFFEYAGAEGNLIRMKFRPDPSFNPPTREAQVFHHMAGKVLIDPQSKRLAEIDGRLITEVKFFWGLLGYLNKGGTFSVRRADVGGGNWKLMRLKVNMHGVALFFKTIGVQENQLYEDYRQNPPSMTIQQAVARLKQDLSSTSEATKSGAADLSH